jgi:uncharacterized protein
MAKKNQKVFEDEMFDLFEEDDFSKVELFVTKHGIKSIDRDGRNLLINFIIEHKIDFALKLISKNKELNINEQDKQGWSALHFAVQENVSKVVDAILKKGGIVDIEESYGNTPLWRGLFDGVDDKIIIKLLEAGAKLTKKNKHGVPPKDFLDDASSKVKNWIKENR